MEQQKEIKQKKPRTSFYHNVLQLILVGSVTGVFAGAITTAFTLLAERGEELSQGAYAFIRANPAWIPLWLFTLFAGAFIIGVLVQISKIIKGCGIPQSEGATRGVLRFKWYRDATANFAACLVSIFMGLSIGAEGPSAFIGACVGDGVATTLRRNEMIKRYQITGGACTGLAVASNAPLTGIIFAFEEAHKRFTPEVFICSFSSVVFGMVVRYGIYLLLGLEIRNAFESYQFHTLAFNAYGYVVAAGLVCGLLGVAFQKGTFALRKLFQKIRIKRQKYVHFLQIFIAVAIGGALALFVPGVMGGGHSIIESIGTFGGTKEMQVESIFGASAVGVLFIVLIAKFLITGVNVASGIPCGIFIPIIAIGACLGGGLNGLWLRWGMNPQYCDLMVMICIAALFTSIVRAPLTAIVMICEFTGSFASLLPAVIGVAIGYIVGEIFRTDGMYEELLEIYEQESGIHERAVREVYAIAVAQGALAEKREVRDVLWPAGARVTEIHRGEEVILPDGDTVLRAGDMLTIVCRTDAPDKVKEDLVHILG
ncbi:MAG: ClC family H(+)/Cl(-) exchange transporter [Clostridiales bacterium]|nr:ClC family H(+)/Cl(-) exchange transporter [Clostridiales bacterium]